MAIQPEVNPEKKNNTLPIILLGGTALCVIVCGLALLGIGGYAVGKSYFEPKTQIILESDPALVSKVDQADLRAAAEILTARCNALQVKGCSFTVAENNQIIGKVPTSVDVETTIKPILAVGLLEFVDFGKTPMVEGTAIRTDNDYPYFPQTKGQVWHTVMTNDGCEEAHMVTDQVGKPAVALKLTDEGTKIFADVTAKNVGRYLGIVLDKIVLSSPVINSSITDGSVMIQGQFTAEKADELATYLRTKGPLPLPLVIKEIKKGGS